MSGIAFASDVFVKEVKDCIRTTTIDHWTMPAAEERRFALLQSSLTVVQL